MDPILIHHRKGERTRFYFNKHRGEILLSEQSGVKVFFVRHDSWYLMQEGTPVPAPLPYEGLMSVVSLVEGFGHAVLQNILPGTGVADELLVNVASFPLSLDVDADRDGVVGHNESGKANWVWDKDHPGAIVLVNNDRDPSDTSPVSGGRTELADIIVRSTKMTSLPEGIELVLYATPNAAGRFSVYRRTPNGDLERILGKDPKAPNIPPITVSPPLNPDGEHCFIEAHEYPGPFFEGLITIELHLRRTGGLPAGRDTVVLRVAPWIMTPNTLPVEEVYTCEMSGSNPGSNPNPAFLADLREACNDLGVHLTVVPTDENKGDRWIQDEVEIGYSQGVTHAFPVAFDSPRDRGLDDFPEKRLFGPDFGHFQIGGSTPNSLDSFGNLEVSPPVTGNGKHYPMGRIIFGGRAYGDYGEETRQMMPQLRRFLYAQKVQSPIEIFTDWLLVGHVDEIVCFVPSENEKGFKLLLASPARSRAILERLSDEGHGGVVMFEGMKRGSRRSRISAEITVDELLGHAGFWDANNYFQQCMDLNREIIKEGLDIDEVDIIEGNYPLNGTRHAWKVALSRSGCNLRLYRKLASAK